MKELKIENYLDDLKPLCTNCKRLKKCKDPDGVCLAKRIAFNYARIEYQRRKRKGLIK